MAPVAAGQPGLACRILGIDPGSRSTGYGVIELRGQHALHLASGCIAGEGADLADRLRAIFDGVAAVLAEYRPQQMAVEGVFMYRNAGSALKLGQARGVALVAGALQGVPVFEYSPAQVKQAIVGRGAAEKQQVQHMIKILLGLEQLPPTDAADALAVALCHGHTRQGLRQ